MRSATIERALLYARTVRHLRPAQIAHRLRLRGQRAALARFSDPIAARMRRPVPSRFGWPEGVEPIDGRLAKGYPSAEANAKGEFRFLMDARSLGSPHDWAQESAAQLWRYNLHYFEWAWSFAAHPDRDWARAAFERLWRSWLEGTRFGRWDAWSPYVASLRAWSLCGIHASLIAGSDLERAFIDDLGLHAGFLRANLERDVGGNHLVKNLKALAGLGVFLGDDALLSVARLGLEREIRLQVLSDGGHYERSPSYHCQVLEDLIDVEKLFAAAGHLPVTTLRTAVESMRAWLGAIIMPDGDVPLFNDCTFVGKRRLKLLQPSAVKPARLTVLQPSGYVIAQPDDRLHLVLDVGPPCPSDLPAHAHADCLSFELAVDGRRIVVDTGTSTYDAGGRRSYERSTAAHNTVEIDGQDQTEVWGVFRAARRATPTLEQARDNGSEIVVTASHDGYRRLKGRPVHRRTVRATPGEIEITDEILSTRTHDGVARLHIAPGTVVAVRASSADIGPWIAEASEPLSRSEGHVAEVFGALNASDVLEIRLSQASPQQAVVNLRLASERLLP